MTKFGVGQAAARIEDRVLVTGAGAYTDDTSIDGQAWACVLRSPHAHARILAIDSAEAAAAPGVVGILTGADMAADGLGDLPCLVPLENRDGSERHDSPHGILAGDRVRYVGHPVALVVAETLAQARDAAERIAVEYEELPVTVHTEHSAADGAPLLYDHIPNNLIYDWHKGDEAGVEAALARAHHVCELRLVNNRVVANPMEPRSALAVHDAASGRTTLAASTQGPSLIRDILAEPVFGIDPSNLRVTTGHVGGGFGMKVFPHAEQALVVWAARRLGRPVKWTSERSEGFLSDVQARGQHHLLQAGPGPERPHPRPARRHLRQRGRLPVDLRPAGRLFRHGHAGRALRHPGHLHDGEGRADQYGAGRRLSRRRAAGSRLYRRAGSSTRRRWKRAGRPTKSAGSISSGRTGCPIPPAWATPTTAANSRR